MQGVPAELWRFPDRTTAIGKMIDAYLTSQAEIDDAAVHLLFSANRWEKRQASVWGDGREGRWRGWACCLGDKRARGCSEATHARDAARQRDFYFGCSPEAW